MQRKPNKKRIGLFVVIGFLSLFILLGGAVWGKIFGPKEEVWVMYFDESVKGLSVGSPVVFRGVEIGKVTKIELLIDARTMDIRTPVYARMLPNNNIKATEYQKKRAIQILIEKGLRARLITQSYLTGQLMIELEMLPNTPIKYERIPTKIEGAVEIPTALSAIGELSKGFQDLPIKDIVDKLDAILTSTQKSMPQLGSILKNINKATTQNSERIEDMLVNINKTLIDVGDMAKALRNMADFLERHPESIIKGKGVK